VAMAMSLARRPGLPVPTFLLLGTVWFLCFLLATN
jgi:hypothetical protein